MNDRNQFDEEPTEAEIVAWLIDIFDGILIRAQMTSPRLAAVLETYVHDLRGTHEFAD